ncbi:MAG: hypothetical protein ACLT8C_02855 [Akkermansia muciniphila]
MKNEVLYGDFVTGHGIHPGYREQASASAAPTCLFLALASKTPARTEDGVLTKRWIAPSPSAPPAWDPMAA